ncbi:MAG TPA: 30S ribosomal protein S9 [Verrucomicrobiales bacterium]|nr:30S ribosomal protein S9 [Verrucomicrobiales bacterium]
MVDPNTNEHLATGRRKNAVARVRIVEGEGKVTINNRAFERYFPTESMRDMVMAPFEATETTGKFNLRVNVHVGGLMGQAGAVKHGLARALQSWNLELRPKLKSEGYLRRDPRMKERKKYGQPGARKHYQYSKR